MKTPRAWEAYAGEESVSGVELAERCFTRIRQPAGTGSQTYIRLFEQQALASAAAWDAMDAAGVPLPPLAGLAVSVKDLFDIEASVTTAGSIALRDAAPARTDATAVARLRASGAVILGTTNMTEFAMGGTGINPHYGTPPNPFDRDAGRIPGGSSSGAAVSVSDGMALAAVGSDTAGSVRMPAALCGIVGFKPTARRVPLDGTIPLATSLDSIGPLAKNVPLCALVDSVLANEALPALTRRPLSGVRLAVPQTLVLDDLEDAVGAAFARALSVLSKVGAHITEIPLTELSELANLNARGSLVIIEGYAWHRELLASKRQLYDPVVAMRFSGGEAVSAADYIALLNARARLIEATRAITRAYDAVIMPTVPITAPRIADLVGDANVYAATQRLVIRNTGIANFLDRCALTVPCHEPGTAPVGFTLMGETMTDRDILALGSSVEHALGAAGLGTLAGFRA